MGFTTVPTYGVGAVLTASNLNTYVRDNLNYLKGLAGAGVQIDSFLAVIGGITGTGALTSRYVSSPSLVASGGALELFYSDFGGGTSRGYVQSYDHTAAAYKPLQFVGLRHEFVNGKVMMGPSITAITGQSQLDVAGNVSLGAYAGVNAAPSNGLIVSGNSGVGTPSPLNKFDVNGGIAAGSYAGAYTTPSNGVIVSGAVGIGTPAPLSKLDVAGGVAIGTWAGSSVAPSNGLIVSGNVGIGAVTAPQGPLHVSSSPGSVLFWTGLTSGTATYTIATCTYGIYVMYAARASTGATLAGFLGDGAGGLLRPSTSNNLPTLGGDTITVAVSSGGTITVQNTTGVTNHRLSFWIVLL